MKFESLFTGEGCNIQSVYRTLLPMVICLEKLLGSFSLTGQMSQLKHWNNFFLYCNYLLWSIVKEAELHLWILTKSSPEQEEEVTIVSQHRWLWRVKTRRACCWGREGVEKEVGTSASLWLWAWVNVNALAACGDFSWRVAKLLSIGFSIFTV